MLNNTTSQTLGTWIKIACTRLAGISDSPALDAELILGHVLKYTRAQVIASLHDHIDPTHLPLLEKLLDQRATHFPIAYITGHKEFFGYDFYVNEHVLVPRPETELLIELFLNYIDTHKEQIHDSTKSKPLVIADICTGSGCIAITISLELTKRNIPHRIIAIDIDTHALDIAKKNATYLQTPDITFIRSDLTKNLESSKTHIDILLSNPPYISDTVYSTSPSIIHEPRHALISENNGLSHIFRLFAYIKQYAPLLSLIEMGSEQGEKIRSEARALDISITIHKDLAGLNRVIEIKN